MLPVLPSSPKQTSRVSSSRDITSTSRTSSLQTQSSNSSTRERIERQTLSRVEFVPGAADLYGAVNCTDLEKKNLTAAAPTGRLKSGPPLLEIRKLRYDPAGKYSVYCSSEEDESIEEVLTSHKQKLFHHETVLVSRGISGLGASVSSTCLSFRPLTEQQMQSTSHPKFARCATGLTSGALCIHTIANLYENDDANPPSSTVAHYAPRQQRPVTSVAWCSASSKNSRLVAIGLTGSGVSTSAKAGLTQTSSVGGRKTPPIRMSPGAGGDRDFGCLVWDIEAQSSSGGGTVGAVGKAAGAAVPIKSKMLCGPPSPIVSLMYNTYTFSQ
jgi:hypothetical protein